MDNNNTLKFRVNQLEKTMDGLAEQEDVRELKADVKTIMRNHLPHIELELTKFSTRLKTYTAINVGAMILGLLASRFLM